MSINTSTPAGVSPIFTDSIVARMGHPTVSSSTPRWRNTSACPSAVEAPWLPIAGTTNGSAPPPFRTSTSPATTSAMPPTPRLPTPTATEPDGSSTPCSASLTAPLMSERAAGDSTACSTSATRGNSTPAEQLLYLLVDRPLRLHALTPGSSRGEERRSRVPDAADAADASTVTNLSPRTALLPETILEQSAPA